MRIANLDLPERMYEPTRATNRRSLLRPALRALLLTVVLGASQAACGVLRGGPSRSPAEAQLAHATFGETAPGRINLRETPDQPRLTVVARDGDPASAVALAVWTDGDELASAGLAALVRARLHSKGFAGVDVQATRDGYRVRGLFPSAPDAAAFVGALKSSLLDPIRPGSAELAEAHQAFDTLRRRPLDGPALLPIARCTGEPGPLPSTQWYDPATSSGAASLEKARSTHHGVQRVALAVVGPVAVGRAFGEALRAAGPWPGVAPPSDPWPERDALDVYGLAGADEPAPRLSIALRVGDAFAAAAIADRASTGGGPLLARLGAIRSWRVAAITATVRPRGACLAVSLQRDPARKATAAEADAASVAAIVANEIDAELSEAHPDPSVAGRQVLLASDPRDAAATAAWWSLARQLQGGENRRLVALGVPADPLVPSASPDTVSQRLTESRARFADAFGKARSAWSRRTVESVTRVESGQGELWVLLASPCGTSTESESDAGITALAAVAAAHHIHSDGMVVEPWISQDGIGVLAHGSDRNGEGPRALAVRAAAAAARAMTLRTLPSRSVGEARRRLLTLLDSPASEHDAAFGLLARTLLKDRPAMLAPFGLRQSLVERDTQSASLRWAAIAEGPMRIAVSANEDRAQANAAVLAADRWFTHASSPRECAPVPVPVAPPAGTPRDVTFHVTQQPPRALVGLSVDRPTPTQTAMLRMLAEALRGPDGWLTEAFSKFPGVVRSEVYVQGGAKVGALVIQVRTADASLDDAVRLVRATLERIAKGGASQQAFDRAHAADGARRTADSLDPRHRIASLWRGVRHEPTGLSLETWRSWLARSLDDEHIAIVRVRPPREPASAR